MGTIPPKKKKLRSIKAIKAELVDNREPSFGPKRSEALISNILSDIGEGMTVEKSCLLHDLDSRTWSRWRRCKNPLPDGLNEFGMEMSIDDRRCWECSPCQLQKRCDRARLSYIQRHHNRIANAKIQGEDVWTASAWLLERTDPETYANKSKQEITHNLNAGNHNAAKLASAIIGAALGKQPPTNRLT